MINRNEVMLEVKYVRGSEYDKWDRCENCTQYPFNLQRTPVKPPSDLCEQCIFTFKVKPIAVIPCVKRARECIHVMN